MCDYALPYLNEEGKSDLKYQKLKTDYALNDEFLDELKLYLHLDSVKDALFNYHAKRSYLLESRFELNSFKDDEYLQKNIFNYNFVFFMKECYDYQFSHAKQYLRNLSDLRFVNLKESLNWLDDETLKPKNFEGSVEVKGNRIFIYLPKIGQRFRALKNDDETYLSGTKYLCLLNFTPTGIIATNLSKII